MIPIQKKDAPLELLELKKQAAEEGLNPKEAYAKLSNPLKRKVLEQLMEEQGHICAYCMRKIPDERVNSEDIPNAVIEHWFPRDPASGEDRGQGLDYNNFLAVCSGNQGKRGTRRKRDLTCDAKRKNRELKINPLDSSTLQSIVYKSNGEIDTIDPEYEDDLFIKLNLNCVSPDVMLPQSRKMVLDAVQAEVAVFEGQERNSYCKYLLSKFEEEKDPKTPYIGIAIWWLKDYIKGAS